MEHRYLQVAGIPEELSATLRFLSASQVVAVTRERASLDDCLQSTQTSYYVTDLSSQASPKALAAYIRQHWNIENQSHWVRDRVFDEDRSQVRVGGAPQVLVIPCETSRSRSFASAAWRASPRPCAGLP